MGYIPGEPNQGLVAEVLASPARLSEYNDTWWDVCNNIRQNLSKGFTWAWYRTTVEIPETLEGVAVANCRVFFETNVDNYGEIWVDGQIDRAFGVVVGNNVQQRVVVTESAVPGTKHVIAVLVGNAPLGEPRGGIFMRYATLAVETPVMLDTAEHWLPDA